MSAPIASATKLVRPILSRSPEEYRRRITQLYKQWYRIIPIAMDDYQLPLSMRQYRALLRDEFTRQGDLKDLRANDLRLIKAEMQYSEVRNRWATYSTVQNLVEGIQKPRAEQKPQDFMSKFLAGQD